MNLAFLPSSVLNNQVLIAVYWNKQSTEHFLVGSLLSYDANGLVLSLVSQDLNRDGMCYCLAPNIYRIEINSQYLLDIRNTNDLNDIRTLANNPWDLFLEYAEKHKRVIEILDCSGTQIMVGVPIEHDSRSVLLDRTMMCDSSGFVEKVNRDKVALLVFDSNSNKNCPCAFSVGDS